MPNSLRILRKECIKILTCQLRRLYKILIKQNNLGYSLPNDRFEDEDDSISSLIASQTVDVSLNQSVDITKEPYFGFDPDARTLFAKNVPKSISRFDIY